MIQHVTEFSASSEETIHKIAEELAKSDRKFKVFEAVYSGGNKPKNAAALAALTGLTETVVLQLATPMAHQQYFETLKDKGRVSFKKYHHINAKKDKILRLAKDPTQLKKHVTTRTPRQTVLVQVDSRKRTEISVSEIFIDDVEEFKDVLDLKPSKLAKRTKEESVNAWHQKRSSNSIDYLDLDQLPALIGFRNGPALRYVQISRMTIIKTPTSYFACASFVTTSATLSSIWFQPSS